MKPCPLRTLLDRSGNRTHSGSAKIPNKPDWRSAFCKNLIWDTRAQESCPGLWHELKISLDSPSLARISQMMQYIGKAE
jgi:hypothetical protein